MQANTPLEVDAPPLPFIVTRPGHPYFLTEEGNSWTPIGQNDAVHWPELDGLFRRRDLPGVEAHLRWLKAHGVTCLRLMLEYAHGNHRFLERRVGVFHPPMVLLWDDLFTLCERVGLYILLTPFDTFWQWRRFDRHPYNKRNGGPCAAPGELLTCPATRAAIKARLAFASDRWGGSPALFAWDLLNEIHPAQGGNDVANIAPFIDDVGPWLRTREVERHGRAHLQTVSIFHPVLLEQPATAEPVFRHPALDFANTHLYERGTIDDPRDTVAPALAVGRLIEAALAHTDDQRPVFDSEHGPIHRFLDKRRSLSTAFDDEYFRHIQWAHVASGGAGGGMRWPNRHPHVLTPGMRAAQRALSEGSKLIDWTCFDRRNVSAGLSVSDDRVKALGCGDASQALLWLVRTDAFASDGRISQTVEPIAVDVNLPSLVPGNYRASFIDTRTGSVTGEQHLIAGSVMTLSALVADDLAVAIRRA